MIWGCVIAFNEEQMLPGCLESIRRAVDKTIVIDGAIAGYPCEAVASTDKTVAIAEAYGARVRLAPEAAWESEVVKRNAYLVGDPGDWYFVIDADERWLGGPLDFMRDGAHYAFREMVQGRTFWTMRLFQQPDMGRLRYDGAHNALWRNEVLLRRENAVLIDPDLGMLAHLHHLRSQEQLKAKAVFHGIQAEEERAYRTRYGL